MNCAIQFSANALGNGWIGPASGYTTNFVSVYFAWGTDNPGYPSPYLDTNPYQPPYQNVGYTLIDGYTSSVSKTSSIYLSNLTWDSQHTGLSIEAVMVDALVHEWYHEWNPGSQYEDEAQSAGDAARAAYLNAGGDSGSCNK